MAAPSPPPPYPPAVLARIAALCEGSPAEEACGVVVRRGGALEVLPLPNAAPGGPRARRDAFELDPAALLRLLSALDGGGGSIAAVWHAHLDAPALPSARDRAAALVGGHPAIPGAEHLVVSVRAGRAVEIRRWVLEAGALVEACL